MLWGSKKKATFVMDEKKKKKKKYGKQGKKGN